VHRRRGGAAGLAAVVIPSLTSRPGVHPFAEIARELNAVGRAALMPAPTALCDRTVRTDKFQLAPGGRAQGQHALVLDDIWTTGSNVQPAALAVRRAGAAKVSVMVVGRWLSPGHRSTAEFIDARLQRDYDPDICPVTGGACP
jgi:adenine/guanine phosphoribosyltransferase-like PRPP-binding protein